MSFERQFLVIVLSYLLYISAIFHNFLSGFARYQLNRNAYKKRKKGQTLKDWFLLSRLKDKIPIFWLYAYYLFTSLHILGLLACTILHLCRIDRFVGDIIAKGLYYSDIALLGIIFILFHSPKIGKLNYSRWVKRAGGQKPKSKK